MHMTTKLVASLCGAAATLIVGSGIASASPDMGSIVNSTCSYPQVMAALNAQNPDVAAQVSSNMLASAWL